ncbi:MAG: hypothetical protein ACE5HG_00335 [Candidatus Bathyarchaeia archaeon]
MKRVNVYLESEDIRRITLKYRVEKNLAYVVGITELKDNPSIPMIYFNTEMPKQTFDEKLKRLKETGEKAGFDVVVEKKSNFGFRIEKLLLRVLSGTDYQSESCPACKLVDSFLCDKERRRICTSP